MENTEKLFANREVCDLTFVDYKTKTPFLNLDFANVTTTELTGESVFAYGGKGHPKRVAFSGEKGGTLTIETQMQSFKMYQLLTGGDVSKTAKFIKRESLTVSADSTVTLTETPSDSGVVNIFAENDDCGEAKNITVAGQTVTITDASGGDRVIAYYIKDITDKVQKISIKGRSFPKAFTVYGDTVMKTENDELLPYKFIAYKVAPQSNMSLGMSNNGDPSAVTITCDLLVNENNEMLDMILEEDE